MAGVPGHQWRLIHGLYHHRQADFACPACQPVQVYFLNPRGFLDPDPIRIRIRNSGCNWVIKSLNHESSLQEDIVDGRIFYFLIIFLAGFGFISTRTTEIYTVT